MFLFLINLLLPQVGCTYLDGYKATAVCMFGGNHAAIKARVTADATLDRVDAILKVGLPQLLRF